MKHGSLFSGIGGFDLAAQWMGWENVFHCEFDENAQRVLKYYWPQAELFPDIKQADFTKYANTIDVLTGGFPCQPYSAAGKRLGKEDERHLWPEMLRAVREIAPRWVVGENVRGLTNWNGGLVFDEVQADLEAIGYEVLPFLLPACAVNAPHRRDRIWFIAHSKSADANRTGGCADSERQGYQEKIGQRLWDQSGSYGAIRPSSDTQGVGLQQSGSSRQRGAGFENGNSAAIGVVTNSDSDERRKGRLHEERPEKTERHIGSCDTRSFTNSFGKRLRGQGNGIGGSGILSQNSEGDFWKNFPTEPPVRCGNDEFSSRLDGITLSKHRRISLKGYGNAVVPVLVLQLFKAIEAYEQLAMEAAA